MFQLCIYLHTLRLYKFHSVQFFLHDCMGDKEKAIGLYISYLFHVKTTSITSILVHTCSFQVSAIYILEIAFNSWENPFKVLYDGRCCDQHERSAPHCTNICETRFEVCLQPSNYSLSNENCPYGRYVIPFDSSIPDPDNFHFTFGVHGTPNPMIYIVPTILSVRKMSLIVDIQTRLLLSTE